MAVAQTRPGTEHSQSQDPDSAAFSQYGADAGQVVVNRQSHDRFWQCPALDAR